MIQAFAEPFLASIRFVREEQPVNLTLREATDADLDCLGSMNRQMCDDEGSRNPMSAAEMAVRMRSWLSNEWRGVLFEIEGRVVGYSVFHIGADYYNPAFPEVHLRQFFIARDVRGRGLGRLAFGLLRSEWFPADAQIHLDVLAANPRGERFWESLGFQKYSTAMRID